MSEEVQALEPVDPDGPPPAKPEDYEVLEDGEYEYDGRFERGID
jgi:hypothetical protein